MVHSDSGHLVGHRIEARSMRVRERERVDQGFFSRSELVAKSNRVEGMADRE